MSPEQLITVKLQAKCYMQKSRGHKVKWELPGSKLIVGGEKCSIF